MLETDASLGFTWLAVLVGGAIFSLEKGATLGNICEGGVLYGGILAAFFFGLFALA
jgi:hypothetical protein